jgi:hypothetical protein
MAKKKNEKAIIESSIKIGGFNPRMKTIFSITNEQEKEYTTYYSLKKLTGKKVVFYFSVEGEERQNVSALNVPVDLYEEEKIKEYILNKLRESI